MTESLTCAWIMDSTCAIEGPGGGALMVVVRVETQPTNRMPANGHRYFIFIAHLTSMEGAVQMLDRARRKGASTESRSTGLACHPNEAMETCGEGKDQ